MKNNAPSRHRQQLTDVISALLIILSVLLTFFGWQYVKNDQLSDAQTRFNEITIQTTDQIVKRLSHYNDALYSLRAYFYSVDDINNARWQTFTENQRTFDIYPGVAALAYVEQVEPEQLDEFLASVRSDTSTGDEYAENFEIFPELNSTADTYNIARYVSVSSGRTPATGFNLSSEPARTTALNNATVTGTTANSGPVALVHSKDPGFQIYLPIYENTTTPETTTARKQLIVGHVAAVFNAQDLFGRFTAYLDQEISLTVSDINSDPQLYQVNPQNDEPKIDTIDTIEVAGRNWQLIYKSSPEFEQNYLDASQQLTVAAVGSAFTVLTVYFVRDRYRRHLRDSH
jgi:CHASE1-domain containing sensor protein